MKKHNLILTLLIISTVIIFSNSLGYAQDAPTVPINSVLDVEWHPNGQSLARMYADGRVEVITVATGQITFSFQPAQPVHLFRAKLAWNSTGSKLAAGIERYVYVWDMPNGTLLQQFLAGTSNGLVSTEANYELPEGYASLEWASDDDRLAAKSLSSRITLWRVSTGGQPLVSIISGNNPTPIVWTPDGTKLTNGERVLNVSTGNFQILNRQLLPQSQIGIGSTVDAALNHDGTKIAISTVFGYISVVSSTTGDDISLYDIGDGPIRGVSWSPDNRYIVAVDQTGHIYSIDTIEDTFQLIGVVNGVLVTVDWHPSNSQIVYGGYATDSSSILNTTFVNSPLITNISVSGSTRTYTRQPNLVVGSTAYTDRVYTYKTVPSQYLGSEYIQTANDDKQTNPFSLNFTLTAPARVYVALDSRSGTTAWPVPAWLSTWQVDPQSVIIGDASMSITHRMYYKDFIAGNVSLGNNGALSPHMMYTVIAMPN